MIHKYNHINPVQEIKEVELGKDTYTLEVRQYSYHILINNTENKVYSRLPKDLRDFFNL